MLLTKDGSESRAEDEEPLVLCTVPCKVSLGN